MITAKARLENSLRTPNNTTLHLEREDEGLKAGVYTGFAGYHSVASNTLHPIKRAAGDSQLPPAGLLLRGFRALYKGNLVGLSASLDWSLTARRFPANGNTVSGVGPWCEIISFTHTSWAPVEP
jgi:hypothetical protein